MRRFRRNASAIFMSSWWRIFSRALPRPQKRTCICVRCTAALRIIRLRPCSKPSRELCASPWRATNACEKSCPAQRGFYESDHRRLRRGKRAFRGARFATSRRRIAAHRFAAAHFRSRGPLAPRCWTLRGFGSRSRRTKDARTSHRRHQPRRTFSGHLSGTADPLPIQRRSAATVRPQSAVGKSAGPAAPGKASPHGLEPGFCKTRVTPPCRHRRRRLLLLCSLLRCARFKWVSGSNLLARNRICGCRGETKYLCRSVPSGEERRRRRSPIAEFFEDCGMSLAHRIIPCLDTDGADELIVLDIAASRDRRPTFLETIRRVAAQLAIPLTAGGGIRSLEDGRAVVRAGADKITVNTAAVERPELISELSREFGAQAVVLAIDAKRTGTYWDVMVRGGRESTSLDAVAWAKKGAAFGAGEILLTSVDRDGTQIGFDTALTAAISKAVSVPVIASGGAKLPEHFVEVFTKGAADAALAASIFHDGVQPIRALKEFLATNGVEVRLPC